MASLMMPITPSAEDVERSAEAASRLRAHEINLIDVPNIAVEALELILTAFANGDSVCVMPVAGFMTTQETADYLNVSRPYVVKLLNEGAMPFQMVGNQRRIRREDVVAYKKKQDDASYAALAQLQEISQEIGLDDL